MATPPPAPAASPAPAPRNRRLLRRSLLALAVSLVLVIGALLAVVGWLVGTTAGLQTLVGLAARFAPVQIEATGAFGALSREFGFAELRVAVDGTRIEAKDLRVQLRDWDWQPLRLDLEHLRAARLQVDLAPAPKPAEPSLPLTNIGVPIALSINELALDELVLGLGAAPQTLSALQARIAMGPSGYKIEQGQFAYGAQQVELAADLGGMRPFPLQAEAAIRAQVQDQRVQLSIKATGSLVDLAVDGRVSGAGSAGTVSARIGSFDTPAVKSLALDIAGIDPRVWAPAAPRADLAVKAQLSPNEAMDEVSGEIQIDNRAPGTIDAERIPLKAARASISASASELKLDRLVAELIQGSARGQVRLQYGNGFGWQTSVKLADVDPARIHSKLQPLRIDGSVEARQSGDTILVRADLSNRGAPSATLNADLKIDPREATINQARLGLGAGFVAASGVVGLTGSQALRLTGEVQRFEPGLLVKDIDARLTGSFTAEGALQPQPNGGVRFELTDSRAWGRPLIASGRVALDAAQRLDLDVEVGVRSARLQAKGGLGAAGRSLALTLDVPALDELLPSDPKAPIKGSLKLNATASGAWTAPAVDARLVAGDLRYGDHKLKRTQIDGGYGGGSDGTLKLLATLAEYAFLPQPNAAVRAVTLNVDGRLSDHGIRLQGESEKGHTAMLAAQGGWRQNAWRGLLRELTASAPVDLRLLAPANLTVGGKSEFGPAQFTARDIRFDAIRVTADAGQWATSGNFSGLQPTTLVPPPEGVRAPVIAPTGERTPLTLRGQWDLRAGRQMDGNVVIERTGGDLYAGRGAESALKLNDLRIAAEVKANALTALARIEAEKGGLGAQMDATVERSAEAGWRLAPDKPWLILGAFNLPNMDWVNALLSDNMRANVRLGGNLASTVRIEGTPAEPRATGRLTGDDLRMAWVDQGMRLENGRLRAHLQDDLIVVDEVHFSGPPRVRPADKRASSAIDFGKDGSVNASGQVRLRDFSGWIQIAADRLPLLQRPDRFVVASGGANIDLSATHVQLNAAVAASAGFIDFGLAELPSLSSDVVVVRAAEPPAPREQRVTFGFDLGIDLGSAFYVRGKGLDTRVEGALRLRSAGRGAISAVGSIATVDGIYEGFGQKLKIARGRLNFQGAPENPGLDILAIRQGLPVEVGVTITRTASSPLVRLYSDPPMADPEALSWLVLGRSSGQAGGDNLALAQAAAGLLGGSGEGYSTRVARSIGIDELSIRSGEIGAASLLPNRSVAGSLNANEASTTTVAGQIVTIGKRLNDALSLSYEQAIAGTTSIVQLNYQLSQRVALVGRTGTSSGLDLVYTLTFD